MKSMMTMGDLLGRLAVGVGDGLLQVVLAHVLARVHVDDGHGLGPVDDQIPAGLEPDLAAEGVLDLGLGVVPVEEGLGVLIEDPGLQLGGHHVRDPLELLEGFLVVDEDPVHVLHQKVPDRPEQQALLRVHEGGSLGLLGLGLDVLVEGQQAVQVLLEGLLGLSGGGGADDDALVLGLDLVEDLAEPPPLVLLLDAAADAHVVHRGHEHQGAPRQGDVGGDPGALGAHRVLGHLDQHALARLQQIPDLPSLRELLQLVVLIPGEEHVPGVQKGVLLEADVHEGRLHARQHVLDLAELDVPHQSFRPRLLHVELHGGAVLHHRHADGEFVGVYQNFLIHVFLSQGWGAPALRRSTSPPAGI